MNSPQDMLSLSAWFPPFSLEDRKTYNHTLIPANKYLAVVSVFFIVLIYRYVSCSELFTETSVFFKLIIIVYVLVRGTFSI